MSSRSFFAVVAVALVSAWAARAADAVVYSGTFQDADGRKGPIQCELTARDGGKWDAKFSAQNKGSGPNRPFSCSLVFTGAAAGEAVNLTGEYVLRMNPYEVAAVLAENKSLKATFKKKGGGSDGTFEMTPGKSADLEAKPAQ